MIALFVYFAACVVALSPATAAVKQRFVSERQASSCTLPTQCTQMSNEYILLSEGITSVTSSDPDVPVNRTADTIGPFLETFCKSDCFDPVLRAYDCTNNNASRNLTTDLLCSRQEDGTLCPVKIVQQLRRTTTPSTLGSLVPLCINSAGGCSTSCQQSLIQLRSRLGCCGANWYGTPSSPYSFFGNIFAVCNVTLGSPCTSGAAGIYLNVLLVAAVFLLSMIMV